ncbi:MAG: hypothetical protein ABFD17_04295 [Anaerolineaceae bacterium]
MPENKPRNVGQELHSLNKEKLAERSKSGQPSEADTKAIRMESSCPTELAANYDHTPKTRLSGQPHFSVYLLGLKIVLLVVHRRI